MDGMMDQSVLACVNSEMNHSKTTPGPLPSASKRQKLLVDAMAETRERLAASPSAIPARKNVKSVAEMRFYGDRLYHGLSVRVNKQKALEWYTAAAKKGDFPSMSRLVALHFDGVVGQDAALKHAEKAAAGDFVTPTLLMMAKRMEQSGNLDKLAAYAPALFQAQEDRKAEMLREEEAKGEYLRHCSADGCNISGVRLKKCTVCKSAWYCGVECQKKDWKAKHKQECGKIGEEGGGDAKSRSGKKARKPPRTMEARALRIGPSGKLEGFTLSTGTFDVGQVKSMCSMMSKSALGLPKEGHAPPGCSVPDIKGGDKVRLAHHVPCMYEFGATVVEQNDDGEWLCSIDELHVGVYMKPADLVVV